MWQDVGLSENYAEIDSIDGATLGDRVLEMTSAAGRARVRKAVMLAQKKQREAVKFIP